MNDDFELGDEVCPKCGHSPTHIRRCAVMSCDDGWIDLYDEDPLWYDVGEEEMCEDCGGTGVEHWCPNCGFDLNQPHQINSQEVEL